MPYKDLESVPHTITWLVDSCKNSVALTKTHRPSVRVFALNGNIAIFEIPCFIRQDDTGKYSKDF